MRWRDANSERPEKQRPILMTGRSGYRLPHDTFVRSGFYDADWRPWGPWLDERHTSLTECGQVPTHWCYLSEVKLP